jgi:hypothetical protein
MGAKKKAKAARKTKAPKRAKTAKKTRAPKKTAATKKARGLPRPSTRTRKASKKPATRVPAARPETRQVAIEALGGHVCNLVVEEEGLAEDMARAMRSFVALKPSALAAAEKDVFRYYLDCKGDLGPGSVEIARAKDVWKHVRFGVEATFSRRRIGGKVYVSLGCACDWEQEHGLQIVFEEGRRVNKVGAFDGHLTNSDAYADPSLENVVYRPR